MLHPVFYASALPFEAFCVKHRFALWKHGFHVMGIKDLTVLSDEHYSKVANLITPMGLVILLQYRSSSILLYFLVSVIL